MAVMIKTLSQLPTREVQRTIDAETTYHEIAIEGRVGDNQENETTIDPTRTWHEIRVNGINANTGDRYWSSWKTALSNEILYTLYSGSGDNRVVGLGSVGIDDDVDVETITNRVVGSRMPGVLKTLELRNGLQHDINLSVVHDILSALVGSPTSADNINITNNTLHLSGSVTADNPDVFKIGNGGTDGGNIRVEDFAESFASVVPNARAVFDFTKDGLPILFSPNTNFDTLYNSESGPQTDFHGRENAIKKETVPHDAYIFRIPNSGTRSESWEAPSSGWFTCFGWISEITTGQASNYQRWVALEGNLNSGEKIDDEHEVENWCILQLQPFYPNPYIGYVGFGVPVRKGLKMRIRTGFAVGASSGNYAMSNTGTRASMSNHIPNCFVGGVYSVA